MSSLDLRFKFGVDQDQWVDPCRVIITQIVSGNVGFWIDEIQEVIETPRRGWGALPALLPRGVFTQTLLLNKKIYLYSEFDKLFKIPTSGYLRIYIEHLLAAEKLAPAQPESKSAAISAAETSASIKAGRGEHENINNNQKPLSSRSTSSNINSGESARQPKDTIPTPVDEQNIKGIPEQPTVVTENLSATINDAKKTRAVTSLKPTTPEHATITDENKLQPVKSNSPVQEHKPTLTEPTHEDAKQSTSENTIKSTTSDHSTLTDENKIKSVKSNSPVQKYKSTKTESIHNDVKPVEATKSKLANQPDSAKSPVSQAESISSTGIKNQHNRSLAEKNATPNKTSTNTSHHQTAKQTGNTTNKSSGAGTAMVLVLLLILVPVLVWYLSKSDDTKPQKKITIAKNISPDSEKQVSNENHSGAIQSTANEQAVSPNVPKESPANYQVEPAIDTNDNALNFAKNENTDQKSTITEQPDNDGDATIEKNLTEIIDNDSTQANQSLEPTTQTSLPQRIETESITTTSDSNTEQADYRADIQSDDDGITIILEVPEETTVFKSKTPSDVETPSKLENDSSVGESTSNEMDIDLRIEKNQSTSTDTTGSETNAAAQHEGADSINKPKSTITQTEIVHIVVKGDTLWHIAIRYVNNPYKYPELARLSNIKNPDLIYPGNRVRIIKKILRPR